MRHPGRRRPHPQVSHQASVLWLLQSQPSVPLPLRALSGIFPYIFWKDSLYQAGCQHIFPSHLLSACAPRALFCYIFSTALRLWHPLSSSDREMSTGSGIPSACTCALLKAFCCPKSRGPCLGNTHFRLLVCKVVLCSLPGWSCHIRTLLRFPVSLLS